MVVKVVGLGVRPGGVGVGLSMSDLYTEIKFKLISFYTLV